MSTRDLEDRPSGTCASRIVVTLFGGRRVATHWYQPGATKPDRDLSMFFNGLLSIKDHETEQVHWGSRITHVIEEFSRHAGEDDLPLATILQRYKEKTPAGRRLFKRAATFVGTSTVLTLAGIDKIIDSPVFQWPSWNGNTIYSDGEFEVAVGPQEDGECVILGVFDEKGTDTRYADAPDAETVTPRMAGKKADSRLPLPTTVQEMIQRLKSRGFEIDFTRRHYSITHPTKPGVAVPMPVTPSDHRWAANCVALIRQVFEIDLRQPA